MSIWKIIKAEYLTNENARSNWLFVLMLVLMGVVIINLSHITDAKVKKIVHLKKETDALRSEYVELKARTMKAKLPSKVYEKLKEKGFEYSKIPPVKINIEE